MRAPQHIIEQRKAKFKEAAAKPGHVYAYGFQCIADDKKRYYAAGKHKQKPLSQGFEPNPYVYQYDMEVHIFIHYDKLVAREIELTKQAIADHIKSDLPVEQLNIKLNFLELYGTGLTRDEHFWHAVELRWPTTEVNGAIKGAFVREPWGEDFVRYLCKYEYVNAFGGSGQGKTHRALAFMCIMWDHYIDSELGGRCRFSTVSESKLQDSTWPYLQRIYKKSAPNISLYCGRGIFFGEYTIARPHDKKGGGSIKGILIPVGSGARAVDKITGSHGHPVGIYHIDELQSTPSAPVEASPNFLQNCGVGWVTASGNYNLDEDSLGSNVVPVGGWDTVDEHTHMYEGINMLGIKCGCIHYNNDLSPAFDGEGFVKWGHMLPTKKKKESRYPNETSRRTDAYRRLWIGWRIKNAKNDTVLNSAMLKSNGAMEEEPKWDTNYPVVHCFSFDSAPTSKDRNVLVHFADGIEQGTGTWKLHFYEAVCIQKVEDPTEYLKIASAEILKWARKWHVKSGNGTLDWTNITGMPEKLKDLGFLVKWVVYNQAPPDGKRRDVRNSNIMPAVVVDYNSSKLAHQEVSNMITMGALLMQNFVMYGQISGLHPGFINEQNSSRSYDEELCLRRFIKTPNKQYGELLALEPKHSKSGSSGFTKVHGFSPDILDCLFQACAFASMHRGMVPGSGANNRSSYYYEQVDDSEFKMFAKMEEDHRDIVAVLPDYAHKESERNISYDMSQYASSYEDPFTDLMLG